MAKLQRLHPDWSPTEVAAQSDALDERVDREWEREMCQCHGLTVPQLHANMALVRAQDEAANARERAAIAVAEHAIANARRIGMVTAEPLVYDGSACTVPHALVVAHSSETSVRPDSLTSLS